MKKITLTAIMLCSALSVQAKEFSLFGVGLGLDSVQVLLKAPFLKCGQSNCTFTALDPNNVPKDPPKLGRLLLAGMQVHFQDKKVTYIAISQHSENFNVVRDALLSKYGKPSITKKYDIDRGAGKFDNEMAYWDSNGVRLALNKRTSYMDMLTVTIKPISTAPVDAKKKRSTERV